MTPKLMIGTVAAFTVASLSSEALAVITLSHTVGGGAAAYVNTIGAASSTSTTISAADFRAEPLGAAGQPDNLFANSWHWRVNGIDTRELTFNSVGMVEASAGNTGSRSWASISGAGYSFAARIDYLLLDGPVGGQAILQQTMTITNIGPAAIDMSLFNYADFDVDGTSTDDTATFRSGDTIQINDSAPSSTGAFPAQFAKFQGVGMSAYEVRTFGGNLRGALTDAVATNLNNTGLPFAVGDFTAAFQWNRGIGAGQSISVVEIMAINMQTPAPGALALIGLAGLVGSRRRRA